jgi:hypothetical protein
MRNLRVTILTVGLVVLAASPAFAQRQRGQFNRTRGAADLLAIDKVQDELKLTDDEKASFTKITDKFKDDIASARQNMDFQKMGDLRKQQNEAVDKAAPDILKPDQLKRFKQLEVQAAGLQAFAQDDVVTALKLTDDQKKSIKEATDDLSKDIQDLFSNIGNDRTKRQEAFTKVQTMSKDALDKVVDGLKDEQKKTWKDLSGDKFDFPPPMRRGNQGGNRGNRGNRNPGRNG